MGPGHNNERVQRILDHPGVTAALAAVFAISILIVDSLVELGVGVAVCYAFVVWLVHASRRYSWIWIAAALCSVLTVIGLQLSPGTESQAKILSNRSIAILAIWLTALLCTRNLSLAARRRRSDELLRMTVDSVGDAVLTTDGQWRVTGMNPLAASLIGIPETEAFGRPVQSVVSLVDAVTREPIEISLEEATLAHVSLPGDRTLLIARDGTERSVELTIGPIRVKEDRTGGCLFVFRDITERREAEQTVRQTQARLKRALEAGLTGTWLWDLESDRVWTDETLSNLFSIDTEQAATVGVPAEAFRKALPEEDLLIIRERIQESLKTGNDYQAEFRVKLPDGTIRWISARGRFEPEERGNPRQMSGVMLDVTERKEAQLAESKLRSESDAANAKFRAIFEQSSIFVGMLSVDGRLTEVNTLALEMCGFRFEDVIGRPFWETGWWSATEESQQIVRSAIQQAARGETWRAEVPYWWADGSEHIVDMAILPIRDKEGTVVFLCANGTDVTERKRTELALRRNAETFARLVEGSPFGIYVIDSQFRVYQVSVGAQVAFRNVRPLIGRDFAEVMHTLWPDPFASETVAIFRHTLETGEPYVAPSLTEQRIDVDEVESYEWQVHRVTLPDGQYGVVCYFFDTTELRQVERALRESEQRAQRANLAKSEFLANMSHEIRTPMAAILGYADMLLTHLDDPDNRQCVATIKRNGTHLLELINDILDLSRIEAGKMDIEREKCDLPHLLADLDSLMRVRVDEKDGLDFRVRTEGKIPATLTTDAKRLKQILINLVGNAIKFTDEGHVHVRVTLLSDSNGPSIQFAVEDTGIGIAPEKIERLYQPFSQADSSVTRQFGGTGLGLTISRRLTDLLGGQLDLESEPEKGTTFYLTLPAGPLDDVDMVDFEIDQARTDETERPPLPRLHCRVLLVDDRRDVRHVAQHFLEEAGASVMTAEDGGQGIDAVLQSETDGQPFDLIVMDMQMPNVDGYTAVSELRARGCELPMIALTADAMRGDRERCLDVGCDDYLSKPIEPARLVGLIRKLTAETSLEELREARQRRKQRLRLQASEDAESAR
ncbi:Sensory/regulatory protein RpfC [Maioricimonas rarisocia]|uniref:histidine kinase n=1 Tax=Maioricimonas rarisocia TaxID=2528026 RepID=A0A517Z335_9PLAN|nr:PAS domain S-box protein [Maioricimonas rarisocia]QDU36856.1 Sensory/regulatory protein RpfC [Maioricimonas rarisocia]